jgi:hypothetical protein
MRHRPNLPDPSPDISPPRKRSWLRRWRYPLIGGAALLAVSGVVAIAPNAQASVPFQIQSLDGSGNNVNHPTWGEAGQPYPRQGTAHYADGIGQPETGPSPRLISNRVMQDNQLDIFSERRVSQWGWQWGQFLDHTFGHRVEVGNDSTADNMTFDPSDPLEEFTNGSNTLGFTRSAEAPGTGTSTANPRQQTNQLGSYIDASAVYGTTATEEDWLRNEEPGGNVNAPDGNPTNNAATLMLPGGYLPTRNARGNPAAAPAMDTEGRLLADPNDGVVAGDFRANENIGLTATQTLFAREHNRVVGLLPNTLSDEDKFQIARRVVIAEEQYITYQEWLPAMGVSLPQYKGYNPNVNAAITNEFATAAYRAHTQVHGDGLELDNQQKSRYSATDLANLSAEGADVQDNGDGTVSIDVAFTLMAFNPNILKTLQEGPVLQALGKESQYNNDEEIDNQLRSTLFVVPSSTDTTCLNGPTQPNCFNAVADLGADDIQRGRDHGTGTFNQMREAYGLPPVTSFTQLTGESTDALPAGETINDPHILDLTSAKDIDGNSLDVTAGVETLNNEDPVTVTRSATLAARLKAIYGNVNNVDAFVGIFAEKHLPGSELGQTAEAIWAKQFQALRDGDRFYFGNDPGLSFIKNTYGIDFRHTLAQIIEMNTDETAADLNVTGNVFMAPDKSLNPTNCSVIYTISNVTSNTFQGTLSIKNTGTQPIKNYQAVFELYQGQALKSNVGGATFAQSGPSNSVVTATPVGGLALINPGATADLAFTASWDGLVNAKPPNVNLTGTSAAGRCAITPF